MIALAIGAATRAKTAAVVPTHRLHRERQRDHLLKIAAEVDLTPAKPAGLELVLGLEWRVDHRDAGIVDHDVQRAVRFPRLSQPCGDAVFAADVHLQKIGADRIGVGLSVDDVGNGHAGPGCDEAFRDGAADAAEILQEWQKVPKHLRNDLSVLDAYYTNLIRTDQQEKAEKELVAALKSEWRGPLVRLYGLVQGPDGTKQLKRAEGWLAKHGEDPDLLLAAARLCLRNELWGKARSYLETVISLRPTPEAYQEYGRLLNQLGERDAAADAYRAGLGMVTEDALPAIPHLDAELR